MMPLAGNAGTAEFVFGCTIYDWDMVMRDPEQLDGTYVTTFTDLPRMARSGVVIS